MTQDEYFELLANIKAIELITRGLFARWVSEDAHPQALAEQTIEALIGSLHANGQAEHPAVQILNHRIEDSLRMILNATLIRLSERI